MKKEKIKEHLMKECLNCHKTLTVEELDINAEKYAKKVKIDLNCRYVALCNNCQKLREEGKIEFFKGVEGK